MTLNILDGTVQTGVGTVRRNPVGYKTAPVHHVNKVIMVLTVNNSAVVDVTVEHATERTVRVSVRMIIMVTHVATDAQKIAKEAAPN